MKNERGEIAMVGANGVLGWFHEQQVHTGLWCGARYATEEDFPPVVRIPNAALPWKDQVALVGRYGREELVAHLAAEGVDIPDEASKPAIVHLVLTRAGRQPPQETDEPTKRRPGRPRKKRD
jgi:hypothetical protein